MAIDNFRRVDFTLDKANDYIIDDQLAKVGDIQGRDLVVQITNAGVIQNQPDIKLTFSWHNKKVGNSGMIDFRPLDSSQGIFIVTFPDAMNNTGNVVATIGVNEDNKWTFSRNFIIKVEENAFTASVPLESDDWATLLTALNKVDHITELTEQQLSDFIEKNKKEWQQFVDANKDIISAIDPGGVLLNEIIKARKPNGKEAYATLGERLDVGDTALAEAVNSVSDVQQNAFMANQASDLNKMSVLFQMPQPSGNRGVFQNAQKDPVTGFIYTCEQTDAAGTQTINKYDPNTKVLITSHNLNLADVVWFEGNSLFRLAGSNDVMFILPYDLLGNWFIYNFDKDEKSEPFKMPGQAKYCIDDSGQYFINIDSNGVAGVNGYVTGFNVFDLQSVINATPKLVNYIPTKDSLVRGSNKIQGFQMINGLIYLGRGSMGNFRTTVINANGELISDYVWNEDDLRELLGFSGSFSIESEGISWTTVGGVNVPVLVGLIVSDGVHYALMTLNDVNGKSIKYTSGVTMADITHQESTGAVKGLSIILPADGVNLLTKLEQVSEAGTYYFTVGEGNEGLAPEMGSSTGMAIVREMADYKPIRMVAIAVDYRNAVWTNYFDNGKWLRWSKSYGRVPLWKGSSTLATPVTLDKPITPYKTIEVLYSTNGGQLDKAYGVRTISINTLNNDGSAAAVSFYESVVTFPTETSAVVSTGSVISLSGNSSGNVTVRRTDGSAVTIIEIWGLV